MHAAQNAPDLTGNLLVAFLFQPVFLFRLKYGINRKHHPAAVAHNLIQHFQQLIRAVARHNRILQIQLHIACPVKFHSGTAKQVVNQKAVYFQLFQNAVLINVHQRLRRILCRKLVVLHNLYRKLLPRKQLAFDTALQLEDLLFGNQPRPMQINAQARPLAV